MTDEIRASRETDRRVGEALGYEIVESSGFMWWREPDTEEWAELPYFSTVHAAAIELVPEFVVRFGYLASAVWVAGVWRIDGIKDDDTFVRFATVPKRLASAQKLPLALCRAFLVAMEGEGK